MVNSSSPPSNVGVLRTSCYSVCVSADHRHRVFGCIIWCGGQRSEGNERKPGRVGCDTLCMTSCLRGSDYWNVQVRDPAVWIGSVVCQVAKYWSLSSFHSNSFIAM